MRRLTTSSRTNWVCLPLAIVLAVAAGHFALSYRPATAGPQLLYRLDQGRQPSLPVQYWIDARFTSEESAAIRAAFATWEEFPGSPISFVYRGTRYASNRNADDRCNTVVRSERPLRGSAKGVIAQAVRTLRPGADGAPQPSSYSDTDIILDFSGRVLWATNGAPDTHDLQSVVTHEVGHILGLDDVNDSGQVMYRFSRPGDPWRRELGVGDQSGLIAAYPHDPTRSERVVGLRRPQ